MFHKSAVTPACQVDVYVNSHNQVRLHLPVDCHPYLGGYQNENLYICGSMFRGLGLWWMRVHGEEG